MSNTNSDTTQNTIISSFIGRQFSNASYAFLQFAKCCCREFLLFSYFLMIDICHLPANIIFITSYIIKKSFKVTRFIVYCLYRTIIHVNEANHIIDSMAASLLMSTFYVFCKFIESVTYIAIGLVRSLIAVICRWKNEKFTFIVVKPVNGKQKNLQLSKLAVYSGTFTLSFAALFLIISSFVLFNINGNLTNEVLASREKSNNLLAINESYEDEIEKLTKNAVVVSEKLNELNVLEYKIRDMVGLNASESTSVSSENIAKPLSRSSDRTSILPSDNGIYVPEDGNEIIGLIENEKEVIDKFSKDLEDRLDFLDARPDLMPTIGRITSSFGFRIHPITRKRDYHKGIDLANKQGTPIFSAGSGIVTYSGYNGGYGRMVIVSHGYGYKTIYAHLKSSSVKLGDAVHKGDQIALMGSTGISTGSHLHFEIHFNGKQINPFNVIEK